ncbi:SAM-dependent methyltransferase [Limibacillus halophilus]|uniref:Cyclopropane-fatty-acyl-phospholipid synthase n=1 Tax=Limibacillus halophilus TaxID=1579333 RepID=A0A839SXV3_9PROT|nr:cyclopropane-fatty-acyl-phospholipid synthase family protein [Limibacillus halophilus]MBB3065783.1 cyclopropane-fatty-acyl-phospholipid synthase [Limibacillus halophilus]
MSNCLSPGEEPKDLPKSECKFLAVTSRLSRGRLHLTLPSGHRQTIKGQEPGPDADLQIFQSSFFRRLFTSGANGFAEAYIAGECDSSDITTFLKLIAVNHEEIEQQLEGRRWSRVAERVIHLLRPNSRFGAKQNIRAHYDLGNAFYQTWLDNSMTYSSAIFERQDMTLEQAQEAKYKHLAATAGIERGHSLLEIGCGWGGFATWAARELQCDVTAITISKAQHDHVAERLQREGLGNRVKVLLQDYRDTHGFFDRIVSIEMFEAVGEAYWPHYFSTVRNNLKPGGRAGLQIITIADQVYDQYRRGADFIQRYVFPGGMLPSITALREQIDRAGLAWQDSKSFAEHYATTLSRWHERFDLAWPQISGYGFDERFRRLWKFYLAYCEAGFSTGRIDVRQISLARS